LVLIARPVGLQKIGGISHDVVDNKQLKNGHWGYPTMSMKTKGLKIGF